MSGDQEEDDCLNLSKLDQALLPGNLEKIKQRELSLEEAKNVVLAAAKDGMAVGLHAILKNHSPHEREAILQNLYTDEQGQCCPLLVIAAKNGHENVVRTLLTKFDVDIESTGRVKIENYIIEGATALWCAAGAGHLPIVKLLVKSGADVNHTTKSSSTPLRAACFDGRVDIVKYLIEEGHADFNIANKFNNTCLMIAAFNRHLSVVKYLIQAGVDPDVGANCGATALHFAAETGAIEIAQELVEFGKANVLKENKYGLTPLMSAAEHCQEAVFAYLLAKCPDLDLEGKIQALELLGASYANDKDHYSLEKCYTYLSQGMKMRYNEDQNLTLPKPKLDPVKAYDNHQECQDLPELESSQNLPHKLHMEGLAVRQRILGPNNPELPHPIIYRGAVFADAEVFDKCVNLWLHALLIKQQNLKNTSVSEDLLRFAQVFSEMISFGERIKFADFLQVLDCTAKEIQDNISQLDQILSSPDDQETIVEELESNMMTFLYLLVIFGKIGSGDPLDLFASMKIIHKVVAELKPKSWKTGRTLIHLAVDCETPINDFYIRNGDNNEFHVRDIVRFPCAKTAQLLIEAGADVQIMDLDGNTPLHLIVGYQRVVGDFMTLHSIIKGLVQAGAHTDVVNKAGKTPMEKASTGVAEIILKSQQKLSLKCLSAQAVKRHGLSYMGQVPATLEHFIKLHGP